MTKTSSDSSSNSSNAWPLVGAIAFMAVSIGIAALVISGTDLASLIPAAPTLTLASQEAAAPSAQPTIAATAEATAAPQPVSSTILISLVPPDGDDTGLVESLPESIRKSIADAGIGSQVEFERTQAEAAKGSLIVAWQPSDDGSVAMTVQGRFEPRFASIVGGLPPFGVIGMGEMPIYVHPQDDPLFAGGLIAAFVEVAQAPTSATATRIQALQAIRNDLPPDKQDANQAAILYANGLAQFALGSSTAALESFSQALRLQPSFPAATVNRGIVYLLLGDEATSQAAFSSLTDLSPYQDAIRYNEAVTAASRGDLDAALKLVDSLAGASPPAWASNLRGVILYKRAEYELALADFRRAASLAPSAPTILFNEAHTLTALDQPEQALAVYGALVALDPANPDYRFQQAMAFKDAGKPADAINALTQAIGLNNGFIEAYLERAWLEAGDENCDAALADAEIVLSLNPDSGAAYQITGDCLLAEEKWLEARKAYTSAAKLGEENISLHANRGWAYHRQRDIENAMLDYQKAIELGSADTTILLRLGFVMLDLNRRKDSLNALSGAVNGGLDTAEAHAGLALALDLNRREAEADQEFKHAIALDARYSDRDFLADQPMWTQFTIARAMTIAKRITPQ